MNIENALDANQEHKEELRPLLEAVVVARPQPDDLAVPIAAMNHSRTRMLVRAEQLRRERRVRGNGFSWRRLAIQLTGLLIVIGVSMTSLIAASAQTLPGDNLYAIKRVAEAARLNTSSPEVRADLVNAYRTRRIEEVQELLRLQRAAPVIFEGVVTAQNETTWEIAGLTVTVPEGTRIVGDILTGMFVEVHGQTFPNGELRAETIYLRAYAFIGTLEAINGQVWTIGGIPVLVTPESQIAPGFQIGDQVVVLAQMADDGTISARAMLHTDSAAGSGTTGDAPGAVGTPTVTSTPDAALPSTDDGTPEPEAEPESTETEFEPGDDNGGETEVETETETESEVEVETETPDETKTPDSTDDNSGSGSSNSGSGSSSSGSGSSGSGDDDSSSSGSGSGSNSGSGSSGSGGGDD